MKTKLFYLVLSFILSAQILVAQAPAIQWQKCLGGSLTDNGFAIQQTSDGGFITASCTSSNNGDVSGTNGGLDIWVVKLSSTGLIQWQKCLGGSSYEECYSIQQTPDGEYILVGLTQSTNGDVIGNHGGNDGWVVKLSSIGTIQWQKCLGGIDTDILKSIKYTTDGGFIVVGRTFSVEGDVIGNHGGGDIWVVKLSSSGVIQWQKCLGGIREDYGVEIQLTTDGGFVIAGYTNSSDGDVVGYHGNGADYDIRVVKLSSNGTIQWQKCLGGSGSEIVHSMNKTSDGGFILTGLTYSNNGDVIGNNNTGLDRDIWIVKLSSTGLVQWQNFIGGSGLDECNSILQTTDGGYILGGVTTSNDGDVSGYHGDTDIWVVKLSSTGTIQWQKCLGGSSGEYCYSIIQTSDGGYGLTGVTSSNDGDVSGIIGMSDVWVVKLAPAFANISLVSGSGNKSTLYPGWTINNGNYDYPMTTTDGINYTISNIFLTGATNQIGGISADYWVKFRQDNNWTTNWGSTAFPSGVGTQGGANINVTIPGNYSVSLNIQTGAYTFTLLTPAPSISIIGANIGTAWNTDVTLSQTDGYLYYLPAYNLPAGELKFRQNNSWLTNWGGTTFPTGDGIPNGSNILATPAGVYDINFFKGPTGANYNFSTTLGIDDQNIKTIKIYPNPASTHINIDFNNETDLNGGMIKFINSLGQEVFTRPITLSGTQTSMQLNTWGGTGIYFVQIINPQGQVMDVKKIIIQ